MKMEYLFYFLLVSLWIMVDGLPIVSRQSSAPDASSTALNESTLKHHTITATTSELQPDCNDGVDSIDYQVQLDLLIQHITTHWKFDHLDAIQTQSYKQIASLVQQHVRITVKPTFLPQQQTLINPSSLDAMDVDILMAQIFGAVQSYTQGSLPLEWDRLGDQLGKPALEAYLRNIIMQECGPSRTNDNEDHVESSLDDNEAVVSAQCLIENSDQLSTQLDRYIGTHLTHIFETMDRQVLPSLLATTSENLKGVLDYFNAAFLNKDDHELLLEVLPWQGSIKDVYAESILPSLNKANDQSSHFFTRYTCLARL